MIKRVQRQKVVIRMTTGDQGEKKGDWRKKCSEREEYTVKAKM